jgi:class 3 adenylate cyclase
MRAKIPRGEPAVEPGIINDGKAVGNIPVDHGGGPNIPARAPMESSDTRDTLAAKLERKRRLEQEQYKMIVDLYGHYRNGTFLSIDVVNSTKLKEGEDSLRVVQTFQAFHRFINECTWQSLTSVFSGDGVMCLFEKPQDAVDVAICIMRGLGDFNRIHSSLRRYLNIRLGINTGTFLVDAVDDLGKVTERDIDLAGHLQKYARPGELLISAATWEKLANKEDFKRQWKSIDNTPVYRYRYNFSPRSEQTSWSRWWSLFQRWGLARVWASPGSLRRRRLALGVLGLLLMMSALLLYGQRRSGHPVNVAQESIPLVVDNQIKYLGPNKYLSEAKIKQGTTLTPLPDNVFLVIPNGKNTDYNRKNGIYENTVYQLEKQEDGRYYVSKYGIFAIKVEMMDDYLIFVSKKDAEDYVHTKSEK